MLWVALGGALGSVARLKVSGWVLHRTVEGRFPLGTFLVNVAGCLAIGILGGFAAKEDLLSPAARLFLFTGLLGGFTTFSAFGLETFYLMRRGELLVAGAYVAASVLVGLVAVWIGFALVPHRG
jgi:CrcB protein